METYTETGPDDEPAAPDLITHVDVTSMTEHDGKAVEPALADVRQRGAGPEQLLGGTHYGAAATIDQEAERGTTIVAPAQPAQGAAQGRLTLDGFTLDEQGRVVSCPAGHAPSATLCSSKTGGRTAGIGRRVRSLALPIVSAVGTMSALRPQNETIPRPLALPGQRGDPAGSPPTGTVAGVPGHIPPKGGSRSNDVPLETLHGPWPFACSRDEASQFRGSAARVGPEYPPIGRFHDLNRAARAVRPSEFANPTSEIHGINTNRQESSPSGWIPETATEK